MFSNIFENAMFLQHGHLYEFGEFRLETFPRRLLHQGQIVTLTSKVFDLLVVLIESQGRILSKEELLKAVWPDTFVEEGNLTQNISVLRKALAVGASIADYIDTVPRQGYRFIVPVRGVGSTSEEIITVDRTQSRVVFAAKADGRGGNFAERGSAEEYSGRIERRRVQEVDELRPELERLILLHHPLLVDGRIPVAQTLRVNP